MTDIAEPRTNRSPAMENRGTNRLREFDLLDHIGVGIARFAEVDATKRHEYAPRISRQLLARAAVNVALDRDKRRVVLTYVALVLSFSALIATLFFTGMLGAFYEAIWSRYPGRPWTHVMRDHPLIYLGIAVPLGGIPYALAPDERWGRAFLTYVIFLVGFLGGHVFW